MIKYKMSILIDMVLDSFQFHVKFSTWILIEFGPFCEFNIGYFWRRSVSIMQFGYGMRCEKQINLSALILLKSKTC